MIKSQKFTLSGLGNVAIFIFAALIILSPDTKAYVIEGLMKIGLFQPEVKSNNVAVKTNTNLFDVQFKDGSGKILQLSQFRNKVIFINFWATWCPPCRAEMPSIEKLYLQFKDNKNFVLLMVDMDDDYPKSRKFLDKKDFNMPLFTPASSIPENMFAGSLPTTVVVNKAGQIVFRHEGAGDYSNEKFLEYLSQLSIQ